MTTHEDTTTTTYDSGAVLGEDGAVWHADGSPANGIAREQAEARSAGHHPIIDVYFDLDGGLDGIVDRDQLNTLTDAEILADLQTGWDDEYDQRIAASLYSVTTEWRGNPDVTILKLRGTRGDKALRIRG